MKRIGGFGLTLGLALGKLRVVDSEALNILVLANDVESQTLLAFAQTPDLMQLSRVAGIKNIRGFIFPNVSQYSHLAGMVNYWGIPSLAVGGLLGIADANVACVDANTSELWIAENSDDEKAIERKNAAWRDHISHFSTAEDASTIAPDGTPVVILAEVLKVDDIKAALAHGAAGVGEIRPELVHSSEGGLDLSKTKSLLKAIKKSTDWSPIPVRFFDFGGEKTNPFFSSTGTEASPLGLRGVRALDRLGAKGLALFSEMVSVVPPNDLVVVLPMVARPSEVRAFSDAFPYELAHLGVEAETPSCILELKEMFEIVDHVVIGPCDLTQFVLGLDRTLITPATVPWDHLSPAVLALIRHAVNTCERNGITPSISLDFRPSASLLDELLGVGLRQLTVPAATIPHWKELLRHR